MSSEPGYLYLLVNATMPGLVKIGRTSRAPSERLAELSSATGVPTAFELVYDILVPDAARAEAVLHAQLTSAGYRLAENREFFRVPIREALRLMLHLRETMESPTLSASASMVTPPWYEEDALDGVEDLDPANRDPELRRAAEVCIQHQLGSTSLLQRRLGVGYGRAARLIDQLQSAGIIGPPNGSKPREILVSLIELDAQLPPVD